MSQMASVKRSISSTTDDLLKSAIGLADSLARLETRVSGAGVDVRSPSASMKPVVNLSDTLADVEANLGRAHQILDRLSTELGVGPQPLGPNR